MIDGCDIDMCSQLRPRGVPSSAHEVPLIISDMEVGGDDKWGNHGTFLSSGAAACWVDEGGHTSDWLIPVHDAQSS